MKILFYELSMFSIHRGVLLDEVIKLSKEGHSIVYLYNNCCLDICTRNMRADSLTCDMCKVDMRHSLKLIPKNVEVVNIKNFWQRAEVNFDYHNVKELKALEYNGVKIGCSVLSSCINANRNLYPKIDAQTKPYYDRLLQNVCNITDALERAIQTYKPERICFFNARFMEWRPPYDLAMKHHIEAYSYEEVGGWGEPYLKHCFVNCTPHNIKAMKQAYETLWDEVDMTEEQKTKLAETYFNNRRNAIPACDKVYIADQEKGRLPEDWDGEKKNIVIFNSSEDEFAAVGDEYDSYALFPSQYRGIRFILDATKDMPNAHIYLRIHPNLMHIEYRYHTELLKLQDEYAHLTVIPAADRVSSYALMDAANMVIVFGSTIGMESAYWGKPVILLAGATYRLSDLCYVPQSEAELKELLDMELKPRDNTDALKIAFKSMYRNPKNKCQYLEINYADFGIGKFRWHVVQYLKLFGSYKLYCFYTTFIKQFYKLKKRKSIAIPMEEDLDLEL